MTISLSCGKQDFPDYSDEEEIFQHEEEEATYKARFKSLNGPRRINASGLLWVKGRQFYVKVVMRGAYPLLRYQQYIHKGSRCPDQRDDLNNDSLLDAHEVSVASGEMLIPLDKNIRVQTDGMEWFPMSDTSGEYYYSRATVLPLLMEDLYLEDPRPDDGVVKLPRSENLDLDHRTIIIYGTAEDPLRPVACAEIRMDTLFQ